MLDLMRKMSLSLFIFKIPIKIMIKILVDDTTLQDMNSVRTLLQKIVIKWNWTCENIWFYLQSYITLIYAFAQNCRMSSSVHQSKIYLSWGPSQSSNNLLWLIFFFSHSWKINPHYQMPIGWKVIYLEEMMTKISLY